MTDFENAQADIRKLIDILCTEDAGVTAEGFTTVLNIAKKWKIRIIQTEQDNKMYFSTELGEWSEEEDLLATILEESDDGEEAENDSEAAGFTEDNAEGG